MMQEALGGARALAIADILVSVVTLVALVGAWAGVARARRRSRFEPHQRLLAAGRIPPRTTGEGERFGGQRGAERSGGVGRAD